MFGLEWNDDGLACIFNGAGTIWPKTVAKFRDPSAWYHIVAAVDTAQATTADRFKLYVNGVEQTLTGTLPTLDFLVTNGTTSIHAVGELATVLANVYVAELYYINDQQLTPGDFGELNTDGVWIPKEYAGTFAGTNSCYLKFDPSAANGIGHDHSGNGNNFSATGFNTSGTGTDVMSDTPTNNFSTLNALAFSGTPGLLADGNLAYREATGSATWKSRWSTIAPASGKWYAEILLTYSGTTGFTYQAHIGLHDGLASTTYIGQSATSYGYSASGNKYNNASSTAYGSAWGNNDIVQIAYDVDAGKVWFGKNGTWQASGDPAAGTNEAFSGVPANLFIGISAIWVSPDGTTWLYSNFGQRDFAYTPPTNFLPLNTAQLLVADIADGSDYFQSVLDTGANILSSAQAAFSSGLWWIKDRANTNQHQFVDSARGSGLTLTCPSLGLDTAYAVPAGNSVAWCWNAGGAPVANTDGTIPSEVSANKAAGFSIVKHVGTNAAGTIGHGLDKAPEFMIAKNRDYAGGWVVYHSKLTSADYYLRLDTTGAQSNSSNYWGNTAPTSSVFSVDTDAFNNRGGDNIVTYCWHSVPGYSSIGSYVGNGNADGPFIHTGFRPAFLLVKLVTTVGWWVMVDAERNTYNPLDFELYPNANSAENTVAITTAVDFTANGFKIRTSDANWNSSGQTLIYAAFAEHPLGGSNVSPAPAR